MTVKAAPPKTKSAPPKAKSAQPKKAASKERGHKSLAPPIAPAEIPIETVEIPQPPLCLAHRWLWTVDEFEKAYDLGAFGFETRLELIEGVIIRKMGQNEPHSWGIRATEEALRRIFQEGYDVRNQLPLILSPTSKPEPDLAVVVGSFNDYKTTHPKTAVLVVEASDSTLPMDRTSKAALYARAEIAEYWIINLPDSVIEVHRQPAPMTGQPLGHHYRSITRYTKGDTLSPLAQPNSNIAVADLLP